MTLIRYCSLKVIRSGDCPACPVCGLDGSSLYHPSCPGCMKCIGDHLEALNHSQRQVMIERMFEYEGV